MNKKVINAVKSLMFIVPAMCLLGCDAKSGESSDNQAEEQTEEHQAPAVTKSKPTTNIIATDLAGREVTEGTPDGYHDQYWRWRIEYDEIKDLTIDEVLIDNDDVYSAIIKLKLQDNGNYYYDTKIKIIYRYDAIEGWKLDNVNSLGMKPVSDGLYDDCVSVKIYSNLYGTYTYLRNDCDVTLTVFYRTNVNNNWKKHMATIEGNSEEKASVWTLDDCVIDCVTRHF